MNRVLIVDDEIFVLHKMETILNQIPDTHVVAALQNGAEARDYLLTHPEVNVVFADIQMPLMNGLELAEWIQKQSLRVQVVMISAHRDFEYSRRAIDYGVRYYLCKPLLRTEIVQLMEKITVEQNESIRKLLWQQDTLLAARFQEKYRHILAGELPEAYFYAEYRIDYSEEAAGEKQFSPKMLAAAMFNVIHSFHSQLIVLRKPHGTQLRYLALATDTGMIPQASEVGKRASAATGLEIRVEKRKSGSVKELKSRQNPVIEKAMLFVEEHLAEDFNRDDVAAAVHFSGSYFSKYFRKETGITFQEYVKQERLQRVIQLMERDYQIKDAAMAAGFRDINHFYTIFRKETGCSPNEYLKRRRSGNEN